jgi:hypothetical protein
MEHPGFDILRKAFNKFASQHDGKEIVNKTVRSIAAGGKGMVDKAMQEFPKSFVKQLVGDFYTLLTSQDVADGISMSVRAFDEEKVKGMVDSVVATLKDDETALKIAKSIKDSLSKMSTDDIASQIDLVMNGRSMSERMVFMAFFEQVRPMIDDMRNSSEEEIAQKIKDLADTIPSDAIAEQVAAMTREVTPERVAKQAHDVVGQMPSPQALADIAHGLGTAASTTFDKIANGNGKDDAVRLLGEFTSEAQDIVEQTIANDNKAKKTFKKDGKDFAL